MELSLSQLKILKQEIEAIWLHLDQIEQELTLKATPENQHTSPAATISGDTIAMLERMRQKIDDQERAGQDLEADAMDAEIDRALLKADVSEALNSLKKQLGIK